MFSLKGRSVVKSSPYLISQVKSFRSGLAVSSNTDKIQKSIDHNERTNNCGPKDFILPILSTESFLKYLRLPRMINKSILALDISYNRIGVACTDNSRKFIQPIQVIHRRQFNERYNELLRKKKKIMNSHQLQTEEVRSKILSLSLSSSPSQCSTSSTYIKEKQNQEIFYYQKAASTLEQLIEEKNVAGIVIGWPSDPSTNKPTKQCKIILQIVQDIYDNSIHLKNEMNEKDEKSTESNNLMKNITQKLNNSSSLDETTPISALSNKPEKKQEQGKKTQQKTFPLLSRTPFTFYDEQYTSIEARKLAKEEFNFKSKKIVDQEDQLAAALILERFLEFEHHK